MNKITMVGGNNLKRIISLLFIPISRGFYKNPQVPYPTLDSSMYNHSEKLHNGFRLSDPSLKNLPVVSCWQSIKMSSRQIRPFITCPHFGNSLTKAIYQVDLSLHTPCPPPPP